MTRTLICGECKQPFLDVGNLHNQLYHGATRTFSKRTFASLDAETKRKVVRKLGLQRGFLYFRDRMSNDRNQLACDRLEAFICGERP